MCGTKINTLQIGSFVPYFKREVSSLRSGRNRAGGGGGGGGGGRSEKK